MGWIWCVHCENFQCDFIAWTCALINLVQPSLHQGFSALMKRSETPQNMSLGSYGEDWGCSLQKIRTQLHCTNFCINCTCSTYFALKFVQLRNSPKLPKREFEGPMGWIVCVHCEKLQRDFVARTCTLIAPARPILHRSLCNYGTVAEPTWITPAQVRWSFLGRQ
jgi:hypothetical protein